MRYYLMLTALLAAFVGAVGVVAWSVLAEIAEYD